MVATSRMRLLLTTALALMVGGLSTMTTPAAAADPTRVVPRFFVPEEPRNEHKLALAELDHLGFARFVGPAPAAAADPNGPGDADDRQRLWSQVVQHSAEMDLVWSVDSFPPFHQLRFSKSFRTKINHVPGTERLFTGDALWQRVRELQAEHEKFPFLFTPLYLVLPRDHEQVPQVFANALKRVEFEMKRERDWYIYQRFLVRAFPRSGNEADLTPASVVVSEEELKEKLQYQFKGQDVELTQYIEPFLLDGHKFQVGFYVVITSVNPLRVYTYGHPSIKIAKTAYPSNLDVNSDPTAYNFKSYIPPWDFPELQKLYFEFPSPDRPGSNAWSVLKRYLMMQGLDTIQLQQHIDDAIIKSIVSNRGYFQKEIAKLERFQSPEEATATQTDLEESFFELMRFDFELDDGGKPWLVKIHSNPSMAPQKSVFGTDEAIKKHLLFDTLNLVGVHPQSQLPFEKFYGPADAAFCSSKCSDRSRTWDTSCWSCPGWFAPPAAKRLYNAVNEYARRGDFKLLFPSYEKDYSAFFDSKLTEHDHNAARLVRSLGNAYADKQEAMLFDTTVTCLYREHCNDNGDCINGKCQCDDAYEGTTCYIPKGVTAKDKLAKAPQNKDSTDPRATASWKNRMGQFWNRNPTQPPAAANGDMTVNEGLPDREDTVEVESSSPWPLVLGIVVVGVLALAYRSFLADRASDGHKFN